MKLPHQHHLAVSVGVEVPDAKVERVEERPAAAVDRRAVERNPERVHDIRPEHHGVPHGRRLRQVVDAAGAGERQDVVGDRVRRGGLVEGRRVPAEEILIVRELVIDASDRLPRLAVGRLGEGDLTAGVIRDRQVGYDLQRGRAEARRIDLVSCAVWAGPTIS
jgi:hypothetical protein